MTTEAMAQGRQKGHQRAQVHESGHGFLDAAEEGARDAAELKAESIALVVRGASHGGGTGRARAVLLSCAPLHAGASWASGRPGVGEWGKRLNVERGTWIFGVNCNAYRTQHRHAYVSFVASEFVSSIFLGEISQRQMTTRPPRPPLSSHAPNSLENRQVSKRHFCPRRDKEREGWLWWSRWSGWSEISSEAAKQRRIHVDGRTCSIYWLFKTSGGLVQSLLLNHRSYRLPLQQRCAPLAAAACPPRLQGRRWWMPGW